MLLGNYNVFNSSPGRAIGGPTDPRIVRKSGTGIAFYTGDHLIAGETDKSAFSCGYAPPYSWILPPKAGGLSAHNQASVTLAPTAQLAGGLPGSGSSTITLTATATGGLIVSGSGSATITLSPTGTLISVAAGSGSAAISLSGTALIGALAGVTGASSITLSPTAAIRAVGYLAGQSTNETEFSPDALARAVWDALAADFNTAGTMGEKMNSAGSAGDPWTTAMPGAYAANTAGDYINKIKKYVANKITISGSTYSVKEDDGSTEFESGTTSTTERTPS